MMHGRHDCTDFSRDYAESFESESDERTRRTVLEFSHRQSHALHMYMRSSHFDLATGFFFFFSFIRQTIILKYAETVEIYSHNCDDSFLNIGIEWYRKMNQFLRIRRMYREIIS